MAAASRVQWFTISTPEHSAANTDEGKRSASLRDPSTRAVEGLCWRLEDGMGPCGGRPYSNACGALPCARPYDRRAEVQGEAGAARLS